MYQQSIEVSKPHFKPVVFKHDVHLPKEDDEFIMPLEEFSAYELELQETISQLTSELEESNDLSDISSCDSTGDSCETKSIVGEPEETSSADSCVDDVEEPEAMSPCEETAQKHCQNHHHSSASAGVNREFCDYEMKLQQAIHELTSLSDVMVSLPVVRQCYPSFSSFTLGGL